MKILSLNFNHDSSLVIFNNGEIEYYRLSERSTKIKHDHNTSILLGDLHEQGLTRKVLYDKIICTNHQHYSITGGDSDKIQYQEIIFPITDLIKFCDFEICLYKHHLYHTFSAFHNSGFEEAVVITSDGGGSLYTQIDNMWLQEHTCVTHIKYPNKILYHFKYLLDVNRFYNEKNFKSDLNFTFDYKISDQESCGVKFSQQAVKLGFSVYDAGKVMGLAQCIGHEEKLEKKWRPYVKECNDLQKESQERLLKIIIESVEKTGCKNVVLGGGFAYNCVANYYYLKHLKDINLFVDPIPNDSGIALGAAYYHYYQTPFVKLNRKKLDHVYLGYEEKIYSFQDLDTQKVSYEDIVKLIIEGNIIAMFQGKSEVGQRSLGNRSLLFDPRRINGKDEVNIIKKREAFRPFGATILLEHVHEWFDMRGLDESPFMMYAVDAKDGIKDKIPAVIHYDNTCRIQTLTKKQNKHFYNLIEKFNNLTGVPVLLNTSFNLAGDPLVETFDDAINTLGQSEIQYLYLPEISTLITLKENESTTGKTNRNHSGSGGTTGQNSPGSDFVYS